MSSGKIDSKLVELLLNNKAYEFNNRSQPELAGILSNGEAVIIHKDKEISSISSYNEPLNLNNKDLTKFNFNNCDLRYAKMTDSKCNNIRLENAILDFASFKNSDLTDSSMCGSSLVYTNLANANLRGLNLNHSDIVNTNFIKKIVTRRSETEEEIDYEGSDLSFLKAIEAYISHIDLRLCNLYNANFTGSTLKDVLLDNCNLYKTNFSSTKQSYITIRNIAQAEELSLENANIQSINIKNTSFYNCSFSNTMFFDLDLNDSVFEKCNFYKAKFINSDLSRNSAIFKNCNFFKSKFNKSSISFDESKFINCNFKESIFENCEIFVKDKQRPSLSIPGTTDVIKPNILSLSLLQERVEKISSRKKLEKSLSKLRV